MDGPANAMSSRPPQRSWTNGTTLSTIHCSCRRCCLARSPSGSPVSDHDHRSYDGTQNTVSRPSSTAGRMASRMPKSANCSLLPASDGNQMSGRPQWPCTITSPAPASDGASTRWYSVRVIAPRYDTGPADPAVAGIAATCWKHVLPRGAAMDRQQQFVLRTLEERDIRFVRLWFTDVLGLLKSVAVAPAELEGAFNEGIGFDGSAIEGFARVFESDMVAKPDPATFQVLPWETSSGSLYAARMFCDIAMPDGSPSWADPRHVLRRSLSKAAEAGFTCYVHPEIEFYLLRDLPQDGSRPTPADSGGYFDQASHDVAPHFRRNAIETLESMGISVEFSHHEGGPGQQEIDLRYADALSTADNIMTFRTVIREVALSQGIWATFMPKPFSEHPGSGMHTHMSLFDGDSNAFHEPGSPYQLSKVGRQFIAGLLRHGAEITAVTNQWVNSYKRLWGGGEAPAHLSRL